MRDELRAPLEKQLSERGLDLVEMIPIPAGSNRTVRLRSLEEALDVFDGSSNEREAVGYLVKVRPKGAAGQEALGTPASAEEAELAPFGSEETDPLLAQMVADTFEHAQKSAAARPSMEGVYYPDGKLNVPFLKKNAELLEKSAEYALARNIYRTMLAAGEARAIAYNGLATCALRENKMEEAVRCLEESLAYQPSGEVYESLADTLARLGRDQSAAETIERALLMKDLTTDESRRFKRRAGEAWKAAGNAGKAEKYFGELAEAEPEAEDIQCGLGELAALRSAYDEAKRRFQLALAQNPRSPRALNGLGMAYLHTGEKKTAHDLLARSLDQKINQPEAVFHLVKIAFETRSYATAARIVGEYVKNAPVNANLLYSLAGLQFHLGRFGEARVSAEKSLEMQPTHTGSKELVQMIERYSGVQT